MNPKPLRAAPNYDVAIGGQWASGPQYIQPVHAVPVYNMQPQLYQYTAGPQVIILQQHPNVAFHVPTQNIAPFPAPPSHNPNDSSLL